MALKKECPACKYRNSVSVRKCVKCGTTLGPDVVYWVDVWVGGRRVRERIGPSRTAAKARELKLKQEEAKAKAMDGDNLGIFYTLADFWPRYAAWCRIHNRDFKVKRQRWEKHVKPFFGHKALARIDKRLATTYQQKRLSEGAKPATINREIALVRHMLSRAVEWGFIEQNPLQGLSQLPENNDDKWKYLTEEDFLQLEKAINPHYRDFLVFLTYTGLRLGDALRVTWKDVDLDGEVILIRGSRTKSGKAFGVPIHSKVKEILVKRAENAGKNEEERIFRHSDSEFRRAFKKALKEAGLPDIRIHDLRHTFASWLALKGIPIQQIQALLGHSQITTTLRYAHLNPAVLKDAVARL
ncbi:phage integrase [Thermodesulfatator atlanticus]